MGIANDGMSAQLDRCRVVVRYDNLPSESYAEKLGKEPHTFLNHAEIFDAYAHKFDGSVAVLVPDREKPVYMTADEASRFRQEMDSFGRGSVDASFRRFSVSLVFPKNTLSLNERDHRATDPKIRGLLEFIQEVTAEYQLNDRSRHSDILLGYKTRPLERIKNSPYLQCLQNYYKSHPASGSVDGITRLMEAAADYCRPSATGGQ